MILAANAASADIAQRSTSSDYQHMADYRAGYEAALMVVATAFGIPVVADGRRCMPGIVGPGSRLAVSDHADYTLARLLQEREEEETHGKDR